MDDDEKQESPDHEADEIVARTYKRRAESDVHLAEWRKNAKMWQAFASGEQWTKAEIDAMEDMKRVAIQYNRIGVMVNAVCGSEVSNRQEARYLPREIGDTRGADIMNDAARWARDSCDAEDEESDAFRDMLITGYGWTDTRMDYDDNPDGMPVEKARELFSMRYDPSARRRNLADKTWVMADDYLTREEIEERWPGVEFDLTPTEGDSQPEQPHDATEAWKYKAGAVTLAPKGKILVIHDCWYETEAWFKGISPDSGQMVELSEEKYRLIEPTLMEPWLKFRKRVYHEAYVVGKTLMNEDTRAECQAGFHYECMTAYRDDETNTFYGIVKPMCDPQKFANGMFSMMYEIVRSNAKGGVMYEDGAVLDVRKFEQEWANPRGALRVAQGALSNNKIQPKPPPIYPPAIENMLQFSVASIRDVTGINVEMLGLADRQQAGILEEHRSKAALTILATVFDSLRLFRKRQGRLMAYLIVNYISDGRLIRVSGRSGPEYQPLKKAMPGQPPQVDSTGQAIKTIRGADFMSYDVIVDEAPTSRDMKERTWGVLGQILPMAQKVGMPLPTELLDYSPLPSGLVEDWKREIQTQKQQPPKPPPEIMKAQMEMQARQGEHQATMQADMAKHQSDMQARQAELAAETQAKIRVAEIDAAAKERVAMINAETQFKLELLKIQHAPSVHVNGAAPPAANMGIPQ